MPTLYMMTSSNGNICTLLALCVRGIYRSSVNSPHKGQWRGALMFSLICAWINAWVNNREAGDLRRHRTHYGVIVMKQDIHTLMSTMLHVTSFSDIVPMLVHFTNICVIYRHRNGKVARWLPWSSLGTLKPVSWRHFRISVEGRLTKLFFFSIQMSTQVEEMQPTQPAGGGHTTVVIQQTVVRPASYLALAIIVCIFCNFLFGKFIFMQS